ncbi:MAG: discoidin domain-containing protein [Anaerolineae bacterium]
MTDKLEQISMHLIKPIRIMLTLIIAITVGIVIAQESATPEPLSDDDTLALLESTGVNVFPFANIEASPPIVAGLSATSTRIEVTTTIPVNCLVVFGDSPDFGRVAQDADMGDSGAHEDHSPILSNLEPETTYYYRLQGSDPQGNFYVSEVYTFTTPPASDTVSENLLSPSRGAEVLEVSSNFNNSANDGSWGILNAFDNDPNTQWSSAGDGDDAYAVVQLGARSQIDRVRFWTRTMSNNTSRIFSFTITDENGTVYGPFDLPDPDQAYEFEVDFIAETLRFDVVESNGGNTGAVEIAVFGEPLDE